MVGDGMEMRNGTLTSRTKARDAKSIRKLAREIESLSDSPEVQEKAKRISRLARDLENDL